MSRIGKLPITVPAEVTITVKDRMVHVKGKKTELSLALHHSVDVALSNGVVNVQGKSDCKANKAAHGTMRALINNMMIGVTKGYEKRLEVKGVGFRFTLTPKKINFTLGFSHPVEYGIPQGITVGTDEENKTMLIISGADKKLVGETAASIKNLRIPDAYKGKGIRYLGERIVLKQGKKAAKAAA